MDTSFITLNDPGALPASNVSLELAVVACSALSLWHALHRENDRVGRFAWAAVFAYGIVMELLSYHAFDNFHHARFTVMFYHHKLPLYVVALYPLFIYTAMATVSRFGLSRLAEPFAVGLAIVLLDVPFDIRGADLDWWTWSATDENLRARWLGVPVTSFYWHLAFGGALAFLVRSAQPLLAAGGRRWKAALLALALPFGAIVLGVLAFIPFHLLERAGAPDGAIVAALVGASALVFLAARKRVVAAADPLLFAVPAFYLLHELAMLAAAHRIGVADESAKAAAIVVAAGLSLALAAFAQRRPSPT